MTDYMKEAGPEGWRDALQKLSGLRSFLEGWRLSESCARNGMKPEVERWIDGIAELFGLLAAAPAPDHFRDAAKMAPAPAEVPMPDVFMYGVKEPDGGAWMQEVCVSTLKGDVDELVDDLNEGRDDADTRYTSVSLVTTEDAKRYGDAREAAGYAHAIEVIKRLRDSHQTATGECQSDCDFVTAWDSAIDALRGEVK